MQFSVEERGRYERQLWLCRGGEGEFFVFLLVRYFVFFLVSFSPFLCEFFLGWWVFSFYVGLDDFKNQHSTNQSLFKRK